MNEEKKKKKKYKQTKTKEQKQRQGQCTKKQQQIKKEVTCIINNNSYKKEKKRKSVNHNCFNKNIDIFTHMIERTDRKALFILGKSYIVIVFKCKSLTGANGKLKLSKQLLDLNPLLSSRNPVLICCKHTIWLFLCILVITLDSLLI